MAGDGSRTNTATADSAEAGPVSASAVVVGQTVRPALSIGKGVGLLQAGPFSAYLDTVEGTPVYYQIIVTNVGNVTLTGVTLSDDLTDLAAAGCHIPGSLASDATFSCVYPGVAVNGQTTNTATAASTQTGPVRTSAVVVGRTIRPVLLITKAVSRSPAGPFIGLLYQTVGRLVYYRIVVTNGGNVPLTAVTLGDSLTDLAAHGCHAPTTLAVGASFTCTYAALVTSHPNPTINTATATSAQTPSVKASATVVGLGGEVEDLTTGQLRITKVIDTAAGWRGGTFVFEVSCLGRTVSLQVPSGRSLGEPAAARQDRGRHGLRGDRDRPQPGRRERLSLDRRPVLPAGRRRRDAVPRS